MDAFRRSRRAKAVEKTTVKGRKVLNRVLRMIKYLGLPMDDFFNIIDGAGKSDGSVSMKELKIGVKELSNMCKLKLSANYKSDEVMEKATVAYRELSQSEAVLIMKVADPSGDGELTMEEFKRAIEDSKELTQAQRIEARVGGVFSKLEKLMKDKGLRLQDLFLMFGGGDGTITGDELKEGLKRLGEPSAKARSEEKRALKAALRKKGEDEQKRAEVLNEIHAIEEAERSGAASVLREFEKLMAEKGSKISDVFRTIDKSGDGLISREELKDGLKLLATPCPSAVFAQKKALERELAVHQKEVKKRAELRHFLTRMHEANESGAAQVIERLEIFLRNNQMRVGDLFKSIDKSGDGALDAEELKEALDSVNLKFSEEEIGCLLAYLDSDGGGLLEASELNFAIRQYRRFRWEAQTHDFSLDHRAPLFEEYQNMEEIFHSSSVFDSRLSENDVVVGLKRLRGDDKIDGMMVYTKQETKALRRAVDKLADFVVQKEVNLSKALKAKEAQHGEHHHHDHVKIEDFENFLEACRLDPFKGEGSTAGFLSGPFDDGSVMSLDQSLGSLGSVETLGTTDTMGTLGTLGTAGTAETGKYGFSVTDEEGFAAVADFLDGGDGEIDIKELEEAFRIARRSKQEEEIKLQGERLMKRLRKLLEYKNMTLDKFVQLMDSATGKSTSGLSIGDGNVTTREFTVGLQNMVASLDKKHKNLRFSSKDIGKIVRYIDPSGSGNMSSGMMKAAFFSNETAEELRARIEMEARAENEEEIDPMDVVDTFAEDIIVPKKDGISMDDILLLISSIDETEDGDVDLAELENIFRTSRRATAQKRLDEKAMKVLRRVKKLMAKLGLSLEQFFERLDGSGSAAGNGVVSGKELKQGLQILCGEAKVGGFNENDLVFLIRFLDPSGEGDLTIDELVQGMEKAAGIEVEMSGVGGMGEAERKAMEHRNKVTAVISKLEEFMKGRGMRLSDLFYWLDRSGDGSLSVTELRGGLERLVFGQSTEDRMQAMKLLIEARAKEKVETETRMRDQKEREAKLNKLNSSGAGDVLRGLEVLMKDKGLRIHDVFHLIDESGDGSISREELIVGLGKLIKPGKGVAAGRLAKQKRRAREEKEMAERRRQQNIFLGKIEEASRVGADVVVKKLERFMRKRQMKLSDLFQTLDRGGDGSLTAEELQEALEKEGLLLPDEEILNLMDYLDKGGDGEIDAKELNEAIKLQRRFAWEEKNRGQVVFTDAEIELLLRLISHGGHHKIVKVGHIEDQVKKSMMRRGVAGRAVEVGDINIPMRIGGEEEVEDEVLVERKGREEGEGGAAGYDDVLAIGPPAALRPGTSQSRDSLGTRGASRGTSRGASRGGGSRMASRGGIAAVGSGGDDMVIVEAPQEEEKGLEEGVAESYLEGLYVRAVEERAIRDSKTREVVEGYLSSLYGEVTNEMGGGGGGWEEQPVLPPPVDMSVEAAAPRPVTAPSGAFEFDLAGGSWSQTFGNTMQAGAVKTPKNMNDIGAAASEVTDFTEVETLKKAVEDKDRTIEELIREVERLREMGRGEGSVVSEMTMGTVDM